MEDDVELDVDHVAPQIEGHLGERREAVAGGVVVEHVDPAETLGRTLDPLLGGRRVGEIDGRALDVEALLVQHGRRPLCCAFLDVATGDARTFARERLLRRFALPTAGAGDQHTLAFQTHLRSSQLAPDRAQLDRPSLVDYLTQSVANSL